VTKRRIVIVAAIVAIVALIAAGTGAFFTAETHVTNVITTGTINIDVLEYTRDENGNLIDWPEGGISGVVPGRGVAKLVSLKSEDGSGDAWVRILVENSVIAADGETALPVDGLLSFDIQDGWFLADDGYYYYSRPLSGGETTPELFTTVSFSGDMDKDYASCTVNVVVSAQAVQKKNNDNNGTLTALTADNYSQVLGWPSVTEGGD